MNLVLVSPHFPPNFYNFAVAAQCTGANVLGLGDAPYHELRPQLRRALTEYYRVGEMFSYSDLLRACGYFTFRYGKLDRLESHNEYWLETDARLRVDFNIPGLRPHEMARVKQKSQMKQVFKEAGLEVPEGQVIHTPGEAEAFVASVGYPIVAKPDVGVGAARTYKIIDATTMNEFWATKTPEPYMMEAYIEGQLHSFDGLTDRDGNIVFATAHVYHPGIMEVVNANLDVYARSFREIPDGLEAAGRRAVTAFDVRERFFHIEFFHLSEEDRWLALEMNMRPPGGPMLDVFNYANDIDLYQQWVNLLAFDAFTAEYHRPYYCAFVGRKHHLDHKHNHIEILAHYGDLIVHEMPMAPVFARAMGNHGYIVRSPDLKELERAIDFILAPA